MENLIYYEKLRSVPTEAQKNIGGGRLKGMTDINPMWRIKAMTELYGPCGIGWKYEIQKFWTEPGAQGEIAAFASINLYFMQEDKWSEPIPGIGGSMLIASESSGLHTSDECYKMALTDAISVACKALGVGADIYWNKDKTKYDNPEEPKSEKISAVKVKVITELAEKIGKTNTMLKSLPANYHVQSVSELTEEQGAKLLIWLNGKANGNTV